MSFRSVSSNDASNLPCPLQRNGIMSLLDEECVFPQGTDQSYLAKLTRQVRSTHHRDAGL
jgi:hypothetical protein